MNSDALIKLSDIIAGTIASLIAILYIAPESTWAGSRLLLIIASVVGIVWGWRTSRERHWIMKIFLYAGMVVLCILVVDLTQRFVLQLVTGN